LIVGYAFLARNAPVNMFQRKIEMTKNMSVVLYIVVLIAVVVSVDLLFFKNRFWVSPMGSDTTIDSAEKPVNLICHRR